ncbi:MAG: N-acetyltransferase [Marivibrio sp.]|uniref:GNAT family N-acetyltransferase n=1 Tax=Marivibrio sp. TaxID=2039719 RepID=UPI0032EB15E7
MSPPGISIRSATADDWPAIWAILKPIFAGGETYPYTADIAEAEARGLWLETPAACFVACAADGAVLGSYFLKANQPGRGAHVCNCGYATAEAARGRGVATALCRHSQDEARALCFRAMQFNFVVSTNDGAVRLWRREGFEIVGTLPEAFAHPAHGFVDCFVMMKRL